MSKTNLSKLFVACRDGDVDTVQNLLPDTTPEMINQLVTKTESPLRAASFNGHEHIVFLLVAHLKSFESIERTESEPAATNAVPVENNRNRRPLEDAVERFSEDPSKRIEWLFDDDEARIYSSRFHWGFTKNRGLKKTVKKLLKSEIFGNHENGSDLAEVQKLIERSLPQNDNKPENLIRAYTCDSSFYTTLNKYMSKGKPSDALKRSTKEWSGYYTGFMINYPEFKKYRFSGRTYRGMQITPDDLKQYRIGVLLCSKAFQSSSRSWEIGFDFAYPYDRKPGTSPVIIVMDIIDENSAYSISKFSKYQYEEEVLIFPGTLFEVVNINRHKFPIEISLSQFVWRNQF